jgi:serine/threonine protein kinase
MAPEVISGNPYKGDPVDIFAAGLILFIMRSGVPPFERALLSDQYFDLFVNE